MTGGCWLVAFAPDRATGNDDDDDETLRRALLSCECKKEWLSTKEAEESPKDDSSFIFFVESKN